MSLRAVAPAGPAQASRGPATASKRPAARRMMVRASAAPATAASDKKTLKQLNISLATLVDSNGGRAVRNIDGEVYEIIMEADGKTVKVLCKSQQVQYSTEVGKDSRIAIVLESAQPLAGGMPSFGQLQALLQFSGPGPEIINGRVAMLAFFGIAATEVASGQTMLAQVASPAGAAGALGLSAAVAAASLAPLLLGRVKPDRAFPNVNDTYPDRPLPSTWTALGELINGRVAMAALLAILVEEAVRGVPAL